MPEGSLHCAEIEEIKEENRIAGEIGSPPGLTRSVGPPPEEVPMPSFSDTDQPKPQLTRRAWQVEKIEKLALARDPEMTRVVLECVHILLSFPGRTTSASQLGRGISKEARAWLEAERVQLALLLHAFGNDFSLCSVQRGCQITYLHEKARDEYLLSWSQRLTRL